MKRCLLTHVPPFRRRNPNWVERAGESSDFFWKLHKCIVFSFLCQFYITIYSLNCLFLIYTKWLWFKPKQTEKAELPNWLILKVIQKPDLFVPPRENRSWNSMITMFNLYMMRTQYVWSTNTKAPVSPQVIAAENPLITIMEFPKKNWGYLGNCNLRTQSSLLKASLIIDIWWFRETSLKIEINK